MGYCHELSILPNLIDLLADEKINVSQFVQNLGYLKGRLNKKCYPLMWNLIDSHDTARFLHLCHDNKKNSISQQPSAATARNAYGLLW